MPLFRARTVHSPRVLPESPRNSAPRTPVRAAAKDDGSPAQTIPFPCRSLRAAGTWNPSPPLSESAGSLRELTDARPRSAEIRTVPSILRAAGGFPVVTLAVVRRAAPAASGDPGPRASAGSQIRLPSSPLQLLPPSRKPSAKALVL